MPHAGVVVGAFLRRTAGANPVRVLMICVLSFAVLLSSCTTVVSPSAATADRGIAIASPSPALFAGQGSYGVLARVRIAAVGDVIAYKAVKESAAAADQQHGGQSLNFAGYGALFAGVAPHLRASDISFANLEAPVVRRPETRPYRVNPIRWRNRFHAPPDLLEALSAAGITVVSMANNHIYDQGRQGLAETLHEVDKAGLRAVGAGRTRTDAERPVVVTVRGVRIALLGYTEFFNIPIPDPDRWNAAWANRMDPDRMVIAIRAARRAADFIVVSVHWGVEYTPAPQQWQIHLAHRLLDAGAHVILGHHPHVLQPIEVYRTDDGRAGVVIYSLGNFISNQGRFYVHGVTPEQQAETRDGVLLQVIAEKRAYATGVMRTELADIQYLPLWTDNDTLDRQGISPPAIRVVTIEQAAATTKAQLEDLEVRAAASSLAGEEAERYARLQVRLDMLLQRKAAVTKRLGEKHLMKP